MDGRRFIWAIFASEKAKGITQVVMNLPNDAAEYLGLLLLSWTCFFLFASKYVELLIQFGDDWISPKWLVKLWTIKLIGFWDHFRFNLSWLTFYLSLMICLYQQMHSGEYSEADPRMETSLSHWSMSMVSPKLKIQSSTFTRSVLKFHKPCTCYLLG